MGTVSRVHTFSAGSVLTAAQLNNEFDNLLTSSAINGGLDATNLGVTAGQITASKALVVDSSRNLDDTTTTNMINNLTLSGTLKLIDDQALTLGTNDDITVKYDETTNDALEIAAAVNGQPLAIVLKADRGDDAADEWKLNIADGGTLTLGNDIASAGTYVTGLTITPNSTTAAWLLDFEGDVDVGGDTLSFNAAATIDTSGNNNLTLSAGTADVVVTASNLAPASNDGSAIGVSGTAWSDVFLASGAVVNFNAGDVTLTHSSNTLTVAGGTLATAALTASTITASGIVKTDDTTDATSTTDGSLQTDGGLSVAKDAVIGDDVKLLSDSAVLSLGADSDATLTHDGTTGVTIAANPITVDSGAALTLDAHTGVFVFKDAGSEVLRFTEGNSGDVTVKLATDGKDLVFTDNGDATNLKILDAAAGINVPGEVQTTKIAYTDGDDAITIADGGGATFEQTLTVGSNGSGKDVQFYGDTSGSNVLVDASADDLILTNFGLAVGSDATGDVYYRDANGFLARLGVGSNGQVLTTNGTIPSWGSAGGSGDFSGPGSSTDNAVVRFDGTGGKTGQNSGVTIDDSNNATGFANLTLTGELDAATGDFSGAVDIAGDLTLSAGADGALRFSAASSVKMLDNSATSLVFEEADNAYMTFVTTNSSEAINFDVDLLATSSTASKPVLTLKNTNNGATSAYLKFVNDKGAAGADNDVCGTITFYGDDDNQDNIEFARIEGVVADASNGDECGALKLYVAENDGNNTVGLSLTGSTTDGEVDATIGAGSASVVTVPGHIDLAGDINVAGELQTANIGYTDGDNAITIADGGGVTFPQAATFTSGFSNNDQDITNVGDIAVDTISGDADSNTTIGFPGSDVLTFSTGGTEALRINDEGVLGVKTTPASGWHTDHGVIQIGTGALWVDPHDEASANNMVFLSNNLYRDSSDEWRAIVTDEATRYYQYGGEHYFDTAASTSAGAAVTFTNRMMIDSSGNVLVGKTSAVAGGAGSLLLANGQAYHTIDSNPVLYVRREGSAGTAVNFHNGTTLSGTIGVNGSSASYNTSSDYRLKENVIDLTGATTRVAQLQPRRFNFIAEPSKTVDGFVAHEVSDIVPEAITGDKDGNRTAENVVVNASGEVIAEDVTEDQWTAGKERTIKTAAIEAADAVLYADGDELPEGKSIGDVKTPAIEAQDATYNDPIYAADTVWHESLTVPVYQGIDQAKLVPLLTAAVQELTARVAALEAA